jgi:hypothetical protein
LKRCIGQSETLLFGKFCQGFCVQKTPRERFRSQYKRFEIHLGILMCAFAPHTIILTDRAYKIACLVGGKGHTARWQPLRSNLHPDPIGRLDFGQPGKVRGKTGAPLVLATYVTLLFAATSLFFCVSH